MKRIISVLLAAAMACSVAACQKAPDAKAIYEEAVKKNAELTGLDMTSTSKVMMDQNGTKIEQNVAMDMKMENLNTEGMKYTATTKMSSQGQNIDMNMFYVDGYVYLDSMGQKVKYPMDLEGMMEQIKQSSQAGQLGADDLKDLKAEKSGDGYLLTYTVDSGKLDGYLDEVMKTMGLDSSQGVELKINSMSGELVVNKDGYYTAMKTKMNMSVTMSGQSVEMDNDTDITVNNPGQPVTVTIPGTDGYTEVDPASMGIAS